MQSFHPFHRPHLDVGQHGITSVCDVSVPSTQCLINSMFTLLHLDTQFEQQANFPVVILPT